MYKIVGIIFLVNTSLGSNQLVFRYPTVVRKEVSSETLQAFASQVKKKPTAASSKFNIDNSGSKSDTDSSLAEGLAEHEAFNLPSVVIAPMLVPRARMCNQPFEISFDNTYFVGYPVTLPKKEIKEPENVETGEDDGSQRNHHRDDLRAFNVVFCLGKVDKNYTRTTVATMKQYKRAAQQIAVALRHEQLRAGYLEAEFINMMPIREAWLNAQKEENPNFVKPDHQALTSQILSVSSLAKELKDIYASLRDSGMVNTKINGWIAVMCSLQDPDDFPNFPIRPYQTLLMLSDAAIKSWEMLPPDSSPAIRKLIELAKPTKSFRELQVETDIPLAQLFRISAHLLYWGKAKVINTLTKTNIYVLNPKKIVTTEQNNYYASLDMEFTRLFTNFRLDEILQLFSTPKPLGEHLDTLLASLQRDFVEVVVWLLQRDMLIQLHTYVFLVIPSLNGTTVYDDWPSMSNGYPSAPIPLRAYEQRYLDEYGIKDRGPTYSLLCKLAPYFRGQHHIEEIIWRENIRREDLMTVLEKYQSLLVTCVHQEGEQVKM